MSFDFVPAPLSAGSRVYSLRLSPRHRHAPPSTRPAIVSDPLVSLFPLTPSPFSSLRLDFPSGGCFSFTTSMQPTSTPTLIFPASTHHSPSFLHSEQPPKGHTFHRDQVVRDMNKLKRQLFANVTIAAWTHRDCLAGDQLQHDIRYLLLPSDPRKNYNIARGSRHSGTGAWLIHGNTLSDWKSSGPSSLLWIHGKR